jgi:hypothetical protein
MTENERMEKWSFLLFCVLYINEGGWKLKGGGWVGRFSTKPTKNNQEIERQFLNHEL